MNYQQVPLHNSITESILYVNEKRIKRKKIDDKELGVPFYVFFAITGLTLSFQLVILGWANWFVDIYFILALAFFGLNVTVMVST